VNKQANGGRCNCEGGDGAIAVKLEVGVGRKPGKLVVCNTTRVNRQYTRAGVFKKFVAQLFSRSRNLVTKKLCVDLLVKT